MKELARVLLLKPLFNLLIFFAALVPGHSIGWAIILITLLVRFALLLPNRRALVAQRKLQELAPKIEELKQRHGSDQVAQGKATMELYKTHGVSPFGACLPSLVQLPILFILYYVFRISLTTNRFDLLYPFTPHPDAINTLFLGIDLAKKDPWILPIIAGFAQFVASWQLMPKNKPQKNSNDMMGSFSKQMTYMFPIMTFFIGRTLPAALSLYWLVTTLFSVAQQHFIFRHFKPAAIATSSSDGGVKTISKGVEVVVRKRNS